MSSIILGITISAIIIAIFFTGGSLSWLFTTKEHKDGNYRGVDTIKDNWDNFKYAWSGGKRKKIKNKK
jgi:hypothetical protein